MAETVPITVAIPTYNRRDKVKALCEAVLAQLAPGDELVVSDNASTDGTAEALAGLSGVSVHAHPVGLGMVGNWNFCLTAGSNDWVCLIHSDDLVQAGGLNAVRRTCAIAAANGRPAVVAHGAWEPAETFYDDTFWYQVREPGASACLRAEFCASGVTIHRAVIEAHGRFDPGFAYSSDMEFFARLCAKVPTYMIRNPGVVQYVRHDNNYSIASWREPDFLEQLERVETAAVGHSGVDPATAKQIVSARLKRDLSFMLVTARRVNDRTMVKSVSRALLGRGPFGRRWQLALNAGRLLGWYPYRLLG